MSKQIHNGEADRRKQVKFRADSSLIEQFDEMVEQSDEFDHRADALRAAMRRSIGAADESSAPLEPPVEEELRTAYLTLVRLSNFAGIIPHDIAVAELSTTLAKNQKVIERRILGKLRRRGYLQHICNIQGTDRSWKLRGHNDGA